MSTTSKEVITTSNEEVHQRIEQQQTINKALDETKNNIRRATDEARKDIPHSLIGFSQSALTVGS